MASMDDILSAITALVPQRNPIDAVIRFGFHFQDFVVTSLMTALWFISSCAWSDGVSTVKNYLDPKNLAALIPACASTPSPCKDHVEAKFNSLNVAIVSTRSLCHQYRWAFTRCYYDTTIPCSIPDRVWENVAIHPIRIRSQDRLHSI